MRGWGYICAIVLLILAACEPTGIDVTPTEQPFYATDFSLESLSGENIRLSDLRGRWVIVNFWATWCVPCVTEMPALQAIAETYADTLTVLGVNLREEDVMVRQFVSNHHISFPILVNPDDATVLAYQVIGLPQTWLVAPGGQVAWRSFGPLTLDRFNETLTELMGAF